MMFWFGGGWAWWQALLMWVGMIAFWGLIIWAIWFFVSGLVRGPQHPGGSDDPGRILDERLARGEIDAEEYRRLRDLIGAGSDTAAGSGARR